MKRKSKDIKNIEDKIKRIDESVRKVNRKIEQKEKYNFFGKKISKDVINNIISPFAISIAVFLISSYILGILPSETGPILKYDYSVDETKFTLTIINDAQKHSATNIVIKLQFIPSNDEEYNLSMPDILFINHTNKLSTLIYRSLEPEKIEFELTPKTKRILDGCNYSHIASNITGPPCMELDWWKFFHDFKLTNETFSLEITCNECEKIKKNITISSWLRRDCQYNETYTACWIKEELLL